MANGVGSRGRVLPGSDRPGGLGGGGILTPGRDFSAILPYTIGADGTVVPIGGGGAGGDGDVDTSLPESLQSSFFTHETLITDPLTGEVDYDIEYTAHRYADVLTVTTFVFGNSGLASLTLDGNSFDSSVSKAAFGTGGICMIQHHTFNTPVDGILRVRLQSGVIGFAIVPITILNEVGAGIVRQDTTAIQYNSNDLSTRDTLTNPLGGGAYVSATVRYSNGSSVRPAHSDTRSGFQVDSGFSDKELGGGVGWGSWEIMIDVMSGTSAAVSWGFPSAGGSASQGASHVGASYSQSP